MAQSSQSSAVCPHCGERIRPGEVSALSWDPNSTNDVLQGFITCWKCGTICDATFVMTRVKEVGAPDTEV
jgi:hypothetical protein